VREDGVNWKFFFVCNWFSNDASYV